MGGFVLGLLAAAAPSGAQTTGMGPAPELEQRRIAEMKQAAVEGVQSRAKLAQVLNDQIFSFAELAFQEVETSKLVTETLERNGFTVERGVAGLPTGWVAKWGSGSPVIALGSDIDSIPKASQKPGVVYHAPIVEGAPGHGEGHNSGQAVNVVAALAVKEVMEREGLPGTLVLWPGVAEELLGGKAYMVREGVFKDVDAVLFTHVGNQLQVGWGQSNGTGMISVEYAFEGESAHAAAAPWRGRSALDAVEIMNYAWNMRREHMRPEQRSHYVITDGGDQPNVVPPIGKVWYFIREQDFANIHKNFEAANKIAEAAATMTETTVTRRIIGAAAPRHFSKPIAEAMQSNIQEVGLPQWTEDEQGFARAVQRLVKVKEDGLNTKLRDVMAPSARPESGGSDDIGDVSWVVPTVTLNYPSNIPNVTIHHWSAGISMATPVAHKGVVAGSKVVAMTTLDLLTRPELVAQARDYFVNVQQKNEKYVPFIGVQDRPQIQINKETMATYRPEMRKYYYDPSKYETYLDQLGIRFPVLQRQAAN